MKIVTTTTIKKKQRLPITEPTITPIFVLLKIGGFITVPKFGSHDVFK